MQSRGNSWKVVEVGAKSRAEHRGKSRPLQGNFRWPQPQYFPKSTAVQMGGVLPYKWEAYCSTNGRCTVGFPFLQGLEARKVQQCKWGAYCRTNWSVLPYFLRDQQGLGFPKLFWPCKEISLNVPKGPFRTKKVYDDSKNSELLRRSVFTTPPQMHYAADPSRRGKMSAIPRKLVSAQGAPR